MDFDNDKPPAGTACAICRTEGHFCPAKTWQTGSDNPLCIPCFEERDCEVFARLGAGSTLSLEDFGVEDKSLSGKGRAIPRSEWKERDLVIKDQPVVLADVPFGLRREFTSERPAKVMRSVSERKTVEKLEKRVVPQMNEVTIEQPNTLAPQPSVNAREMVMSLNNVLAGVLNGTVKVDQANAACQIVNTMLKCVETDWRMNPRK